MADELLRHDVLHLNDDDFGSKHGRDRTAKETAARNLNETAGYKAAEADAKKEAKQGSLFGVNELNELNRDEMKKRAVEKLEQEEARKYVAEENKAKREADEKKSKLKQRPMISPGGNILKGAASGSAGSNELIKAINKPYKAGGKVSSASSRADGCAIRGKTRA
jgi:hypothetical protein